MDEKMMRPVAGHFLWLASDIIFFWYFETDDSVSEMVSSL